ncbi:hypothetical protein CHS0354_031949, partial [Potamilus streckersoni]
MPQILVELAFNSFNIQVGYSDGANGVNVFDDTTAASSHEWLDLNPKPIDRVSRAEADSVTEQLVYLSTVFIMIVVGNTLVLVAIVLSGKRRSRMNFFMINLVCA